MIVRVFDTAMDPADIEKAKELFRKKVKPTFEAFEGCDGIEMELGIDEHSRDYVDVAAVSRWESMEAIAAATKTPEYEEAMVEFRQLFQQVPLVRHFEEVD